MNDCRDGSNEKFDCVAPENFNGYLSQVERGRIFEICREFQLFYARDIVPPNIREFLQESSPNFNPSALLMHDIERLSACLCIKDGNVLVAPLSFWLQQVALLIPHRVEAEELKSFADKVVVKFALLSPVYYQQHRKQVEQRLREILIEYYLPFLKVGQMWQSDSELADQLESAIRRQFSYEKKVVVRDLKRTIKVSWGDEYRNRIKVDEISSFEFIPFTKDEIVWEAKRFAAGALDLNGYTDDVDEVWLSDTKLESNDVMDTFQQVLVKTYRIPIGQLPPYAIQTTKGTSWCLDSDPTFEQTSPYVAQNCSLEIQNEAPGLRISYHDIGGSDLFRPTSDGDKDHNWDLILYGGRTTLEAAPVLLPGQGYMLVMARTSRPREPDS